MTAPRGVRRRESFACTRPSKGWRRVFEERFSEAVVMLMALGAEHFRVRSEHGWGRDLSAEIDTPARVVKASAKADSRRTAHCYSRLTSTLPGLVFTATRSGTTTSRRGNRSLKVDWSTGCSTSRLPSVLRDPRQHDLGP
jgi:hypothetical protein